MWGLNSVIWLIAVATAESPEVPLESAEHSLEAKDQVLLEGIMLELKTSNASAIEKEAVLKELSVLVDTRRTEEERVLAVRALNEIKEDKTLPFYWEILGEIDAISWEILDGLTGFSNQAEVGTIIQKGLYTKVEVSNQTPLLFRSILLSSATKEEFEFNEDLILKAITIAGQVNQTEAAELLLAFTKDLEVPYNLREVAFSTLESNYPEFLEQNGRFEVEKESDMRANLLYAGAIGTTTSVLLGSVGVWGQSDTSEGLGYGGGAIMGSTAGYLYADQLSRPSLGQSTLMASSVTWGIVDSAVLADSFDLNPEQSAFVRTIGVTAGAGYGYWQRDREVDYRDVLELDFMGYWGAQMGVGLRDIVGRTASINPPNHSDYYPDEYYYEEGRDEEAWAEYDASYNAAYVAHEEDSDLMRNKRQHAMLLGSAIGLGVGHTLTDTLNIREESIAFAGVYSAEFTSASLLAIEAFDISSEDSIGMVRTGIHAAMGGALVYDYYNPVTYDQSLFSAYGSGIGHLLGAGAPYLLKADDRGVSHGMLWSSLAGTAAGTYLGNELDFNQSDWVMNGVGMGLSAWHFGALSSIVDDYGLTEENQDVGLMTTGLGLSGLGLIYAGTRTDVSIRDSVFFGMTTAWGAYYGGLLPIALDMQGESHEHLLMTLVASDIGLLAGSYAVFKAGYEPERATIPQLMGLTGLTLGALGASLFTEEAQAITASTLVGGTIGLVGGTIWEKGRTSKNTIGLQLLPDMNLKMAQKLRFQMTPQVDQEGNVGVFLGLHN